MTMRIGIGAPPVGVPDMGAGAIINLLKGDPWLTNKSDGRPGERIVTSWTWDDSYTVLTLKLRRDVYFHDDTLLTPQVAAEALRASVTARDQASLSSVASVQPQGDDTVVIKLKEPNGFLLLDLTAMMVTKPGDKNIGTGPYRLVSKQNNDANLTAFTRYYRGRPALSGIDVVNYPTQRKAWAAMMRGDIDMLHEVSREAAEFVEAETSVNTFSFPRPYYIPLTFNARHPILRDARVRRAINQAVDRTALVREGLRGRGSPSDGPVFPQNWAYAPPAAPFVYNPAAARQLLDEAGYPARPNAETAIPIRFSFTCLVFAEDQRFDRIALLVQRQLADVGIDMRLVPVPLRELGKRAIGGEFDAFIMEISGRSLSRVYEFWRSGGGFINPGYTAADTVLDRIRAASSDEEIRTAVADFVRVMHEDPPAAFLAWEETSRAVRATFDVVPDAKRDILTNLWMWRPATAPAQARR